MDRTDKSRRISAMHGTAIQTKSWLTEAALRMLCNNLDPDVALAIGPVLTKLLKYSKSWIMIKHF